MNEDIEVYLDDSGSYLEALIKSRKHLKESEALLQKLDQLISLELDLGVMAAEKAKSEILKKQDKDNIVRPIK